MHSHPLETFLLERIGEDEQIAQEAIDAHESGYHWGRVDTVDGRHLMRWNPWRVISSCMAKRLIITAHSDAGPGVQPGHKDEIVHACRACGCVDQVATEWPCYTLKVMALSWADHPDYRPDWRPRSSQARGSGEAEGVTAN